jgi:uncharacterized protein (TIGR00299 family) protein
MRAAYFDCSSGISGNMVLGALLDAGLPQKHLLSELKKLSLNNYKISISKTKAGFISPTLLEVKVRGEEKHRKLSEIIRIINKSKLRKSVKELSKRIFAQLAEAEAKVHGTSVKELHFHELGATDAIVDITGTAIGIEKLGIRKVYSSPLNVGRGRVKTKHGTLKIPAPATTELLKGIPVYTNRSSGELTTPTGAAIIRTLCNQFGDMPKIKLGSVGHGAGSYKLKTPNTLRIIIGEAQAQFEEDAVAQIETDIDDMNPEIYGYLIERLMKAGALDAHVSPNFMKKGRPAATLSVLSTIGGRDKITKIIFSETTSLGIRTFLVARKKLKRKTSIIKTRFGKIRAKLGFFEGKVQTASPEFRDCEMLARARKVPLKLVYSEANKALSNLNQ